MTSYAPPIPCGLMQGHYNPGSPAAQPQGGPPLPVDGRVQRLPGLESLDLSQVNKGSGHMYLVAPDEEGRYCSHLDLSVPAGLYWERDDWDMVF